ncbi:unnamed protein product, partial [Symbiodinium necroappetens]
QDLSAAANRLCEGPSQAGPDSCLAQPLQVRKYLGQTSIKANLFDTKQMLVNFELAGMVPSGRDDEYGDLVEDFERYKREADEWAYSSSWAEANPGGGRDRTEARPRGGRVGGHAPF